ncbi:hypothetical protein FIBSPDRAFT_937856 [Athelia psychrophila]|uniref:MYND-type domain-containing protein n=1 Tax=Athelia psychrophila TaxID=1759441 RepID=A0A165ZN00_9AGAM|nr:hypothetical protein FIBSPDRAFT_937856 [Fibularhizoctonia sp. CBS 109695]
MPPPLAHKQCQNCYKNANPPQFTLKSCQNCSIAHYCNRDCQRADWPNHKKVCKRRAEIRELIRASSAEAALDSTGQILDLRPAERKLKQWISHIYQAYRTLLAYTLINALTLQTTPDRCMTHMLYIALKQTSHKDAPRYFAVEELSFRSISEALQLAEPNSGIESMLEKSRQIRAEGGTGVAIAMIYVAEFHILHLTPTVVRNSLKDRPINNRWDFVFIEMVAAGNTGRIGQFRS